MKLQKIQINEYKSIKNPIEVSLSEDGSLITFIGKNGSGKTNILQALRRTLVKSSGYSRLGKETIKSQYTLKVVEGEKKQYFSVRNMQDVSDEIIVDFSGNDAEVKKVQAPILSVSIETYKNKLENLLEKLKRARREYIRKLKEIECSYDENCYISLETSTSKGSFAFIRNSEIEWVSNSLKNQIKEIKEFFDKNFSNGIVLNYYNYSAGFNVSAWPIKFYQIAEDKKLSISPIVGKSLNLTKENIEKANKKLNETIKKINEQLKIEYESIQSCLKEFETIKKEIAAIFGEQDDRYHEEQQKIDENYEQFCRVLKKTVFKIGYYLDNEDSLLFYNQNDAYRRQGVQQEYLNSRNPIVEAMDEFLRDEGYYKENESLLKISEIEDKRIKAIEQKLNVEFVSKLMPAFDKDEIQGYRVSLSDKKFALYVKEKSGEEIDFNATSLGRRWYLTYGFVKKLLKRGDCLFIDEPAAFLHPQAQAETRKELEKLAERGIYVFITTHSPYMIPANWKNVYNVSMTGDGTMLHPFGESDELCDVIKEELGISRTSDILFNLSKTLLLVEGIADKACLEKTAKKCGRDLRGYHLMPCNGSPIIALIYLCIKENIKFKALLDADNKSKPLIWLSRQFGYKEYLDIIKNNKNCVFTPEEGKKQSLEDCFSEQDGKKCFTAKGKIDSEKIEKEELFSKETLDNFEQLFIKLGIPKLDK